MKYTWTQNSINSFAIINEKGVIVMTIVTEADEPNDEETQLAITMCTAFIATTNLPSVDPSRMDVAIEGG